MIPLLNKYRNTIHRETFTHAIPTPQPHPNIYISYKRKEMKKLKLVIRMKSINLCGKIKDWVKLTNTIDIRKQNELK